MVEITKKTILKATHKIMTNAHNQFVSRNIILPWQIYIFLHYLKKEKKYFDHAIKNIRKEYNSFLLKQQEI